ncbi:armadillo repeat-containing protein 2 isoform X2 [Lepeophtheirus salmonis]|uniref:armadillo repeat-containing protein 2 isoform X2 n=1 Tax=Lepeophtheirus salmonis TaxID=72036 RepID=UPI001AEA512B|nr:armadillo repeat-containing protein 2-like isoform X2 [Lepeophtheirus salmonis]
MNENKVLSSYFNQRQKTSAEIISEAKASVRLKESNEVKFMRPLSTKRPFTPRQKERYYSYDKSFSASIDGGGDKCRPLSGIKLEPLAERQKSGGGSKDSSTLNSKLPCISSSSSSSSSIRQQFRLQLVKEDDQESLYDMCQSLKNSQSESQHLKVFKCIQKKILGESISQRDVSVILELLESRPELIIMILHILLSKINEENNKSKSSSRLQIFKTAFQLSKKDDNDGLFVEKEDFLQQFLTAMGLGDPIEEPQALIYGYGTIKFLSMNSVILNILEKHGFVDLLVLHLKIIAKFLKESSELTDDNIQHALFQMTASLRNALNSASGRNKLKAVNGLPELEIILKYCIDDPDVVCNLSRIFSVMSADDEVCDAFLESRSLVTVTLETLFKYSNKSEVVVRLAYSLGNLLGQYDEIRKYLYDNRFDDGDDVAVKIIRIFANASINPEAGTEMAICPNLVETILRILDINESDSRLDLLISTVSTLNNLSFYPIFSHHCVYDKLIPKFSFHDNIQLATESMRVLGNLSRKTEIRNRFATDGYLERLLISIPSKNKEYDYSTYGVMVNMMVDAAHRPIFRQGNGFQKSLEILEEGIKEEDFVLCTLVCQALWNYSIDLESCHVNADEITDLNDILSIVLYQRQQDDLPETVIDTDDFEDLYSISQGLLIRYNKIVSSLSGESSSNHEDE